MKRIIENLIVQRKKKQENVSAAIDRLAEVLDGRSNRKGEGSSSREALQRLKTELEEWVTLQDREWDAMASNHATAVFKSLQWKIDKLESEYSLLRTLLSNFVQLEKELSDLVIRVREQASPALASRIEAIRERVSVFQYAGFEERFRGTPERVRQKLQRFLPYFAGADGILDLGCGRGEFLELLRQAGIRGMGVDISESMLDQARDKGLDCRKSDALAALQEQPGASLGGIFSSQVIEHFPPDYLRQVVQETVRVLTPGAVLVLETINPLSLYALSRIYHLDPSHRQPLHPEYLRYLLESAGFHPVEIVFSDELSEEKLEEAAPELPGALAFNRNVDKLNRILFSPPEFAAIGKKP